jgi:hypothetical protein
MSGPASAPALKNNQRAKPAKGGARPGAGRKKGEPNKATGSLRDLARQYTTKALKALVTVLEDEEQPAAARVSAASAILDRGYGKPSTVLSGDEDGGAIQAVHKIILEGVAPK